ncbi:MAG: hypothetical protein P4L46_23370 [Fimbriimonas sp.]|nr:hypothetical protein [Fimbriimonas sp.]
MKQNPYLKPEDEEFIRRGVLALRSVGEHDSAIGDLSDPISHRAPSGRPPIRVSRYVPVCAAIGAVALVTLWPRPLHAASIQEVIDAVNGRESRYEQVLVPDSHGQLNLQMERWGAPGKFAERFRDGTENRFNGHLNYQFHPQNRYQVVDESKGSDAWDIDPVGIKAFAGFKLEHVEAEGAKMRYSFKMAPGRQDLVFDAKSKLPLERDVIRTDGSLMEVHRYFFLQQVELSVFDPEIKAGITTYNLPQQRLEMSQALREPAQSKVVAGIRINLHAVVVDPVDGMVAVVVSGGDPRPPISVKLAAPIEITGISGGFDNTEVAYTTLAGRAPDVHNSLVVKGEQARVETVRFPDKPFIPNRFTIRVPVWKLDRRIPLLDWQTKMRIRDNSRQVGVAEFQVDRAIRTSSIDAILPNHVIQRQAVGKATTAAPSR